VRNHDTPLTVARACTEALGHVSAAHAARLTVLRDDASRDSLLRVLAGRALSRLTRTKAVTNDSLDRLVLDAREAAKQ
jgi:hypothetical protein